MNIHKPRKDFIIVEDYFTQSEAEQWIKYILEKGEDSVRGFHHPHVRPNRFHKNPKYPVKKYMCFGLYWNPVDYLYYQELPLKKTAPFEIPNLIKDFSQKVLSEFYHETRYRPEAVMVNFYTQDSSMGLHVDKDEIDKSAPIIGVNFGSTCRFFYENEKGEIQDIKIPGNSFYIFGRSARLMRHGLGSIYTKTLSLGSENYLSNKERLNLTIRQVNP